jgi:hypothetical protein
MVYVELQETEEYGEIRFDITKNVTAYVSPVLLQPPVAGLTCVLNTQLPVYSAFDWLVFEVVKFAKVQLDLRGFLGHDVNVLLEYSRITDPQKQIRSVNRQWFNQAVQARAALLRQKVKYP